MSLFDWFADRRKGQYVANVKQEPDEGDGLWSKCPECGQVVYLKDLKLNASVCANCGHHHRIDSAERIALIADPESFQVLNADLSPVDPLGFKDRRAYADRLRESQPAAEQLFNAAIQVNPDEPLSWVARGLSRGEQGKDDLASRDLAHASQLFADQGDMVKADQLKEASQRVYEIPNQPDTPGGNGVGSALISGALSAAQALAPIALKALMPMIP